SGPPERVRQPVCGCRRPDNSRTMNLSEHETIDAWKVTDGNKFRAWIHRDGDVDGDDYKTMKLTLQDVDTAATLDFTGGGAAPA
ncbi:MAG TPA: hypothetical protein PLB21_05605, partial [Actinomycetota bacterium]|nr:hypothetical protein [Actinomycetota bacterium]